MARHLRWLAVLSVAGAELSPLDKAASELKLRSASRHRQHDSWAQAIIGRLSRTGRLHRGSLAEETRLEPRAAPEDHSEDALADQQAARPEPTLVRGPQNDRQQKIVDMMKHAWNEGYVRHCWGKDELHPVSRTCDRGWQMGLTLVDSLDTLYLMGMDAEFKAARDWVADPRNMDFGKVGNVNLFETTIRVLGGLLGAHALTGDEVFLQRATQLGDRLFPALGGLGHGVPFSDINLGKGEGQFLGGDASTAEATTLGLEFKTLSHLSGSQKFARAVEKIGSTVHGLPKKVGLLQTHVEPEKLTMHGTISLGSRGDSYYEYLLKQWLLTGKKDKVYLDDYLEAVDGIRKRLVQNTSGPLHLTYVAELSGVGGRSEGEVVRKMDHLVCFLPGLLALGSLNGASPEHLELAKQLTRTCHEIYVASGHMLGAEIAHFETQGEELYIKPQDSHDILRPETVESLFYLYRSTRDTAYQDMGWEIANAIEKHAKVDTGGYTSLASVLEEPPPKRDKMESFFLAETLKYLYLLFDDGAKQVPLDAFVFNTEAHPLRIFQV